jgi:hypothetical protein
MGDGKRRNRGAVSDPEGNVVETKGSDTHDERSTVGGGRETAMVVSDREAGIQATWSRRGSSAATVS